MAAKKKKARARQPADIVARAVDEQAGDQMYVRIPLRPVFVQVLRERIGAFGELFDLAKSVIELADDAESKVSRLVVGAAAVAKLLEGDAKQIGAAVKHTRRKR